MPKCPKCNTDIEYLLYERDLRDNGVFSLLDGLETEPSMYENTLIKETYKCPKCNKVLFTDYEGALSFLEGIL